MRLQADLPDMIRYTGVKDEGRAVQPDVFKVLDAVRASIFAARETLGFEAGEPLRLAAAVSGGMDSVALLHMLYTLRAELCLELFVAHFDHALRAESEAEAELVRQLALDYQLPFETDRAGDCLKGENIEAWARRNRYFFLERARRRFGAELIVTAHHKNDQAETLLFRLLSSRLSRSAYCIDRLDEDRRLLRPLLELSRREIEQYAVRHKLRFAVDRSNFDTNRARNALRHDLIPLLEARFNPNAVSSLAQYASRAREDEDYLWELARRVLRNENFVLDPVTLRELPDALGWRVILLEAERALGSRARKLGYGVLKDIERLILKEEIPTGGFDIGFGMRIRANRLGEAGFSADAEKSFAEGVCSGALEIPGDLTFGALGILRTRRVAFSERSEQDIRAFSRANLTVFFAAALSGPLIVRTRRDGDQMRVWKRGRRKLKKLFQERHIGAALRDRLPVVEAGGEVIWVPGIARSSVCPVEQHTTEGVELSFLPFSPSIYDPC